MKLFQQNNLFPLVVLAFMGPAVAYLSALFDIRVRWGLLAFLIVAVLFSKRKSKFQNKGIVTLLGLCSIWALTTTFWSESFDLSFMKAMAFLFASVPLVLAGQKWVATKGIVGSWTYLAPVALVAMMAAVLGYFLSPFAYSGNLFQGFVYGPNMMGSLLAIALPCLLWQTWRQWHVPRWRTFWILACLANFGFIYITQSRGALLVALCSLGGMCLAFSRRKTLSVGFLFAVVVVLIVAVRPGLQTRVVQQVIYKHSDDVFYTRVQPWSESWEKAQLGGFLGAGYGVSIGSGTWGGGLTAVGYGREKGNSQLAIVEETGLIGLFFYLILVITLVARIYGSFANAKNRQAKVALGLGFGAVTGMLLQSVFEAWWVAPGAPEAVAFWALVGVCLGLCSKKDEQEEIDES